MQLFRIVQGLLHTRAHPRILSGSPANEASYVASAGLVSSTDPLMAGISGAPVRSRRWWRSAVEDSGLQKTIPWNKGSLVPSFFL